MVQKKRKRLDLEVPACIREEWEKGPTSRNNLAELLLHFNGNKEGPCMFAAFLLPATPPCSSAHRTQEQFVAEVELSIRKSKTWTVVKDQGWYSESEMKADLKWSVPGTQQVKLN